MCVCVIACLEKHARELYDLTALILQLVLGSTQSKALKITSETLDLDMLSLGFMGPKPEANESALSLRLSFW